jgi:putative ABC transport system permease protein
LVSVAGLLREGITVEAAAAEINTLGARLRGAPAPEAGSPRFEVVRELDQMVANVRPVLRMLVAAVALVLLIVCANVANLLLVRGTARGREIGIRQALGASRSRIVSQLLTEGVVLALAGGVTGVALTYAAVPLLRNGSVINIPARFRNALGALGPDILPRGDEMAVDPTVLAFALVTSLLSGILFALAPALRLARSGKAGLGSGNLSSRDGLARGDNRIGRVLAVAQIALATTLLIGSGLLLHSFLNLSTLFLGFDADTQIFQLVAPQEYSRTRKLALAYELSERLMAQPVVASAGFVNVPPLASGKVFVNYYVPEGQEHQIDSLAEEDKTIIRGVSPGYLSALGARLVEGRWLDERDSQSQSRAMLVNRAWAERFSPRESPVGKTVVFVTLGRVPRRITWEVVGVVEDIRWTFEGQPAEKLPLLGFMDLSQLFAQSAAQRDMNGPNMELDMITGQPNGVGFAVRTSNRQLSAADLRGIAAAADPAVSVDGVASMGSLYAGLIGRQRFYAIVVNVFGAIAGVIAAIGIYGVLAYAVAKRTQEFGIRMALGARRRDVLGLVLGQGLTLIAAGTGVGVAGAIALTRYLSGMLYGLTALDPLTYVAVAVLFTAVTLVASYLPARRATKVDPLVALRYE